MMNKIPYPYLLDVLDSSIAAFRAALSGPDPDGKDKNAPTLDDYLFVLHGRKLNLQGWTTGHPLLGSTIVTTSMLIHVTEDKRWARTFSRWYRLEKPRQVNTSKFSSDIEVESFCPSVGADAIGIPLRLARMVLAQRPDELARIALNHGYDEAAASLSRIDKSWPPRG